MKSVNDALNLQVSELKTQLESSKKEAKEVTTKLDDAKKNISASAAVRQPTPDRKGPTYTAREVKVLEDQVATMQKQIDQNKRKVDAAVELEAQMEVLRICSATLE